MILLLFYRRNTIKLKMSHAETRETPAIAKILCTRSQIQTTSPKTVLLNSSPEQISLHHYFYTISKTRGLQNAEYFHSGPMKHRTDRPCLYAPEPRDSGTLCCLFPLLLPYCSVIHSSNNNTKKNNQILQQPKCNVSPFNGQVQHGKKIRESRPKCNSTFCLIALALSLKKM